MAESVPDDLKYLKTDQWIHIEGHVGTIGITAYAQEQLNDVVYVELPAVGKTFSQEQQFGVVESVKSTNDLFMPLSGEVTELNPELEDNPEIINDDPYGEGWMIKIMISNPSEADNLLDSAGYATWLEER